MLALSVKYICTCNYADTAGTDIEIIRKYRNRQQMDQKEISENKIILVKQRLVWHFGAKIHIFSK